MFQIPPAFVGPCGCRLVDNMYRHHAEWFKDGYWVKKDAVSVGLYNGRPHFCRCQVKAKPQRAVNGIKVSSYAYKEQSRGLTTYSRTAKAEYFR